MAGDNSQDEVEAPAKAVKVTETSTNADPLEQTWPAEARTFDTELDRIQETCSDVEVIPAGLRGLALPVNQDSSVKLAELEVLTELTVTDLEEQERQDFPAQYSPLPRWQQEQDLRVWWLEGDNRYYARGRRRDDWGPPIRRSESSGAASWDSGWDDHTIGWRGHTADGWNMPVVPEEDEEHNADRDQGKEERFRPSNSSEENVEARSDAEGEVLDKQEQDGNDGRSRR